MPRVSIIMPVYNGDTYLKQAINSVLVQSYPDWELLAIDDGSTDKSGEIVDWYATQDSRIKPVHHAANLKLVATLNEGLKLAEGEYIARLDCDDWWSEPTKLSRQVEYLDKHPRCALVGTWAKFIAPNGKHLKNFTPPTGNGAIRSQMLWHNCFVHSTIMARKEAMLKAGGYSPEEKHVEDYGLWLRMGKLAEFGNIPEIMLTYRVMASGVTGSNNAEQVSRILELIKAFRGSYPNYWLGWLKWRIQKFVS